MREVYPQRRPPISETMARPGLHPVFERYLGLVVEGDRTAALRLVVAQVEDGADADALLTQVVDPLPDAVARLVEDGSVPTESRRHAEAVDTLVRAMLDPPVFTDLP